MQGLVVGRYIFTDTSKRGGGGIIFQVMAKQGDKISFLKILNYTSPPPLINYDQSLITEYICVRMKQPDISTIKNKPSLNKMKHSDSNIS
jgi:hypothetical protein